MKQLFLLVFLPLLLCAQNLTLTLEFTNVQTTKGPLGILLFTQKEGFPDDGTKAIRSLFITGNTVEFDNLEPGTYAVSVFQDLNGNEICDTGWLGIPTEPYGFSNYSNKRFLAPRFKRACFTLDPANTRLTVPLLD